MNFGQALRHISMAFHRNADKMLEKYGLTASQMGLMIFLFRQQDAGRAVIQRDIEAGLGLKTPTVSGTLDRLEKNGFIRRRIDPDNRRVNRIEITEKAEAMKQESKRDMDAFEKLALSPLSEAEQKTLEDMLRRVYDNLPK